MEQIQNWELFAAYENLLATLGECKTRSELAIATKKVQDFEEEYPEFVDEYYYEEEYNYNE